MRVALVLGLVGACDVGDDSEVMGDTATECDDGGMDAEAFVAAYVNLFCAYDARCANDWGEQCVETWTESVTTLMTDPEPCAYGACIEGMGVTYGAGCDDLDYDAAAPCKAAIHGE